MAASIIQGDVKGPITVLGNRCGFADFGAVAEHAFEGYFAGGADGEFAGAVLLRIVRITVAGAGEGDVVSAGEGRRVGAFVEEGLVGSKVGGPCIATDGAGNGAAVVGVYLQADGQPTDVFGGNR